MVVSNTALVTLVVTVIGVVVAVQVAISGAHEKMEKRHQKEIERLEDLHLKELEAIKTELQAARLEQARQLRDLGDIVVRFHGPPARILVGFSKGMSVDEKAAALGWVLPDGAHPQPENEHDEGAATE